MDSLKNYLLNLDIVTNNEYLDKYIDLIERNSTTIKEKYKTHSHHIVPKCYFRHNNISIDNSLNNKVNLLIKDHLLAHYYLALCSKEEWFKIANILVLQRAFGDDKDFIYSLTNYELLQTEFCDSKSRSKQISNSMKGRIQVSKGLEVHTILKEELQDYLDLGFELGNNILKNKVSVTKDGVDRLINKNELDIYLSKGYVIGHSHLTSQKSKGYVVVHNLKLKKETKISKENLNEYMYNGYELGGLPTNKRKQGHPCPYKGTKGLVKSSCGGTTYVTNGLKNRRIKNDKVESFLNDNPDFYKGMTIFKER